MRQDGVTEFAPLPSSVMPGIVWPAMPDTRDAAIFAILTQLEMTQWWPPQALARHQLRQAAELVEFAARTVPFYRDRLAETARHPGPLTMAEWRKIPLLTRAQIQEAGTALAPRRPLKGRGDPYDVKTSGSTGEPVTVQWDAVTARFHAAFTLRDHLWHKRDFSAKVAVIRMISDKIVAEVQAGKAARWASGYPSGPMVFFDLRAPVDEALAWLAREDPAYLVIFPTYLRAMIQRSAVTGVKPAGLREIATVSEVVDDDLRALCQERWNAPIVDMYSTQETGFIALECPDHPHYHIQSECCLVEVLDGRGQPCQPGEIGRVVVTALHNFATPLIRYDLDDFAEVGAPCACGRGLPVIRKIIGRSRNMVTLPDGSRIWITFTGYGLEKITAIRQVQLVQKSLEEIQARLVVARPLTPDEEALARDAMRRAVRHDFTITLDYVESIARSAGGKFEAVISEIPGE